MAVSFLQLFALKNYEKKMRWNDLYDLNDRVHRYKEIMNADDKEMVYFLCKFIVSEGKGKEAREFLREQFLCAVTVMKENGREF